MRIGDLDALKKALEEDMKYGGVKTDEFDKGYDLGIKTAIEMLDNATPFEITEEQAIDKLHETGWLIKHDKEMTERPQGDNKEALFVLNHLFYDCDNMTQKEYDILLEAIKERPHGKWIPKQLWDNTHIWVCSECGNPNKHGITTEKACWKCGAKMDGKEADNEQ